MLLDFSPFVLSLFCLAFQGALHWFNKNFVKTRIVDEKFGKIYKRQFENRLESDYEDYVEFSIEEVKNDFESMINFVSEIEKLLK